MLFTNFFILSGTAITFSKIFRNLDITVVLLKLVWYMRNANETEKLISCLEYQLSPIYCTNGLKWTKWHKKSYFVWLSLFHF